MIEHEPQQVELGRNQKRRGYAYLQRTQLSKTSQEMTLKNDLIMRNRPGIVAKSDNVYETYIQRPPRPETFNYFFSGRKGTGSDRNVNYWEATATVVDEDKKDTDYANILILDLGVAVPGQSGARIALQGRDRATDGTVAGVSPATLPGATGTENGGIEIAYVNNSSGNVVAISVDKSGISMYGLPTASTGLATGAIWNDAGTLKIVT